jgi:hypothetical protein
MRRSITVGESTKIAQTSVETQFSGEMSLGTSFSKENQKQAFGEVIRSNPSCAREISGIRILMKEKSIEEKIFFKTVILRDILGDDSIGKSELSFHECFCPGEVKRNALTNFEQTYLN